MKFEYSKPEIELELFQISDVITMSDAGDMGSIEDPNSKVPVIDWSEFA